MEVFILSSGSHGNSCFVVSDGKGILIDAGISRRQISWRLETFGFSLDDVEAVLLTHEHSDHVRGLEVLCRNHRVPVWASPGTWGELKFRAERGGELVSGKETPFGRLRVLPVATSHDAAEPLAFVIDDGVHRIGYCTDTGVFTTLLKERMQDLDIMLLEANHDRDMLRHGPYPWPIKQRIGSSRGHLGNHQAAEALQGLCSSRLRVLVAMHLSEENNSPEIVRESLRDAVGEHTRLAVVEKGTLWRISVSDGEVDLSSRPAPTCRPEARRRTG